MARVDYTALVQRVEGSLAAISFAGGLEHQPKIPVSGVSTKGLNHELLMKARGNGVLCRYIADFSADYATPGEIITLYDFLEHADGDMRQLVAAVKILQSIVANQDRQIVEFQKPNMASLSRIQPAE